jgi:ATP-dependent Clp protease adapter protein ClpS
MLTMLTSHHAGVGAVEVGAMEVGAMEVGAVEVGAVEGGLPQSCSYPGIHAQHDRRQRR